jgi:hypothetical protein
VSEADEDQPLLSAEEERELLSILTAALRPSALDRQLNERLLERALEDPLAPPTDAELLESARLRDALEAGSEHAGAAALGALRAAFHPLAADAAADRALPKASNQGGKSRGSVVYAVFGAAGASALLAASFLLFFGGPRRASEPSASATTLAKPRSTTSLFDDRFDTGGTTERIDRIASARGRELRDNRYASWGVR